MIDPIEDIRDTLFHARLCCNAWWQLEGAHQERQTIVQGFESFPVLFETMRPAFFVCFIVKICSLFGSHNDEITLRSLPNAQQDQDFARLWDVGRRLYRYRNKFIAHRDASKARELIAKKMGMTFNDLRALPNDVSALFDRIAAIQGVPGIPDIDCQEEMIEAARRMAVAPQDSPVA